MFSLKEIDDFWSQISSTPNQLYTHQQDPILDHSRLVGSDLYNNKTHKKPKKLSDLRNDSDDKVINNKMMRRDTERQRRKEMATLFASLRSLLPIEYIKGKRSASDHMGEAVSYIKHLEKKIKELSGNREKLKRSNSSAFRSENETLNNIYCMNYVMVSPCLGGLRIMLSSSTRFNEEELKLSKVLEVLLEEEGLSVISCVSTKVNQRLLHTVQIEVSDQTCLNLSDLQQKLHKVVILRAI